MLTLQIAPLLASHLAGWVQISAGPHGFAAWLQPPHISLGVGWVRGSLTGWAQVQR